MAVTRTFNFTGGSQTFQVPSSIAGDITVELYGAAGGLNDGLGSSNGGYVKGTLAVNPGDVLYCFVGGEGQTADQNRYAGFAGGWNGGGDGGGVDHLASVVGSGGGGATDIRINGTAVALRVAVAGGGGGCGGAAGTQTTNNGGDGGAATGAAGQNGGGGGTQTAGGAGGQPNGVNATGTGDNGSLLNGGNGAQSHSSSSPGFAAGAGGGGGYYGGGGGGVGDASHVGGAGGGGSNYTGGLATVVENLRGGNPNRAAKIVLTYSLTPNAPSPYTDTANNYAYEIPVPVSWEFSDPDAGQSQAAADVRWRVGSSAWTELDSVAASVVAGADDPNFYTYSFAANTFAAYAGQQIEWQVRTYNTASSTPSPWSPSAYFKVFAQPAAFVFDSAPVIDSPAPSFSGARSDSGQIAGWNVKVTNDNAGAPGATILSEFTNEPANTVTAFTDTASGVDYTNGTSYHILVAIEYPKGVWQAAATDSGAIVANIDSPLAPTLSLASFDATASVRIDITNPGSDPNPPDHNRIYRTDLASGIEVLIHDNVGLNASYTDFLIGFNRQYRYRVEAVTASGAVTSSD